MVRELKREKDIDKGYYNKLVDDAKDTISEYGDFEWFVSDDPYIFHNVRAIENAGKEHNNGSKSKS